MDELTKKKSLDDDLRNRLHAALKEYKANFVSSSSRHGNGVTDELTVRSSSSRADEDEDRTTDLRTL